VEATPVVADLTAEGAIDKTCNALRLDQTHLDVLVHCAGVYSHSGVLEADSHEISRLLTLNVAVPILLTRRLADRILAARGDIVFVNSSIVYFPKASAGLYAASRHALVGVADSLRQELRGKEVGVLTVFVGATATPMQEEIFEVHERNYDERYLLAAADVARAIHNAVSLDRSAEVTELHIRPRRLA
jgi:short-subunit dehydrogenase